MKKDLIVKIFLLFLSVALFSLPAHAQKKRQGKRQAATLTVSGLIVNEAGEPLRNVAVTAGEGALTVYSDHEGRYTIKTKPTSPLVYMFEGYEPNIIYLADEGIPSTVVLLKADPFASSKDIVNRGDGENMYDRDVVGAVSAMNVENLKNFPDLSLSNAMQGQAAGLIVRAGNGGFGKNTSTMYVRGQHSTSDNAAMIIVDGVQRGIDNLIAEEIESVEVLKDVTAKMLYGPSAANGVVLVTTKRGLEGRKVVRASAEYGVMRSMRVPEFLGSHEYATLYNEARANDGLQPRYTASQLEGYKNSKGANDALYPDVDWYGEFLRKQSSFIKAAVEFSGGNRTVRYALVAGYLGGSGLEKLGKRASQDQINIRGNLDIKLNRFITFKADVAGRLFNSQWGMRNQGAFMSSLSTNKPNEYALTIDPSYFGGQTQENGIPYFGGSTRVNDNLYADVAYRGSHKQRDAFSQMNVGLDFNMDKLVKGLSAEAYFTFDNYNSLTENHELTYPTYSLREYFDADGQSQVEITQLKKVSVSTDQTISDNNIGRVMGMRANIAYNRTFGRHGVSAVMAGRYFKEEYKGVSQDFKNMNFTLRLNYDYAKKYFAEVGLGYMGSNVYYGADQYLFAPTAGLAWIISKENFLKDVSWLDYLKVKASAGVMGSDASITPIAYNFSWTDDGTWAFGPANGTNVRVLKISTLGNPDLKWEKQKEMNVGVEAMFLSRRLSAEVNYFLGKREDIVRQNTMYSSALGDFVWYENVADVTNRGVDACLRWGDRVGPDFGYSVGVNFTYTKNRIDRIDEGEGVESYRSRIGKATSANIALDYAGMFGRDIRIEDHPYQSFGPVEAGDLAYVDQNGDRIIDGRDQTMLGQSFPLTVWGIDLNLNYKGFGLYVLGTAETGVQKFATGNFFHNYGENSYSVLARDAYHPVRNPSGSQPRLSTMTDTGNNWRNSGFWARDCSFFRLKNVELSYTFRDTKAATFFSTVKVFVRGTNLLVISPMKDADPERLVAGVDNYPAYRTFSAGVAFTF